MARTVTMMDGQGAKFIDIHIDSEDFHTLTQLSIKQTIQFVTDDA